MCLSSNDERLTYSKAFLPKFSLERSALWPSSSPSLIEVCGSEALSLVEVDSYGGHGI